MGACQPSAPAAEPPPAPSNTSGEPENRNEALVAVAPTGATDLSSPPSAAAHRPDVPFSDEESVSLLVDSRIQSITPEDAKKRLTRAGEVREMRDPVANDVVLRTDAASSSFEVSYVRDSAGAWGFIGASMSARAVNANEALAAVGRYDSILQKRFGKPTWVADDEPPPPTRGWDLERGALSLRLSQRETPEGVSVLLEYSEPAGEAE